MQHRRLRIFMTLVLVGAAACFPPYVACTEGDTSCDYYTREDAERLFGVSVSGPTMKATSLPAGKIWRYTFPCKGGTCGLTLRLSSTSDIAKEGIFESAKDQMDRQKRTRMSHEHASTSFRPIAGLGDDAFWSGKDLWILKGDMLIIIIVHSAVEGAFSTREAADKAQAEQDLSLSQKVAVTVLSRLSSD